MVDPLSLSSGIAGLLSLTIEITKITYEYISAIKEAPKSVRAIITEVTSLENVLRDLRNKIVLNPEIAEVLQSLQLDDSTRVHVLQQCEVDLRHLLVELQTQTTSGIPSGLARLKWPFKEPEIQKKLERLQWLRSQLTTLTTHDTLVTSALTYKAVKDWRSEDLARKILEWFSPLDFNAKQHDMFSRRHPGTMQWILDSPEFKEWLESDTETPQKRTLWCAGSPGAGKTVASSIIIARLVESAQLYRIGVAYVYCNYDDQISQTPERLIGSLVKQLASQLQNTPEFFSTLSNARRTDPPTTEDCLDMLKQLSNMFTRTFLVIDALDEEENSPQKHRSELIAACKEIAEIGNSTRLLVTSRPYLNDINSSFADAIRLNIAASDEDLQAFIRGRIDANDDLQDILEYDDIFKEHIIADVLEKSAGQFLLPALHIERLNDLTCKDDIEDILKDLTSSVEETYKKTFDRLKDKSKPRQELATNVLLWLSHTKRPLKFEELQEAVAFRWNDEDNELLKKSLVPRKIILEACLGLVMEEAQSGTIRLVHHSLEQYFKAHHRSPVDPHAFIGRSLLSYLSRKVIIESRHYRYGDFDRDLVQKCPLLPYAFHFWNEHSRSSEDLFEKAILDYFAMHPKTLPIAHDPFQRLLNTDLLNRTPPLPVSWKYLFYAVVLQIDQLVRRIVQRGANPLAYYAEMGCPSILTWICCQYMDTIHSQSLLEKALSGVILALFQPERIRLDNPEIHAKDQSYMATIFPLLNENAMKLVLERGFDVNRVHRFSRPAGFIACFEGSRAAATALHIAAYYHSPRAIQILLEHGADVNRRSEEGQTALGFALDDKHLVREDQILPVIRALLGAGANEAIDRRGSHKVIKISCEHDLDALARDLVVNWPIKFLPNAVDPPTDATTSLQLSVPSTDVRPLLETVQEDQVSDSVSAMPATEDTDESMLTQEEQELEALRRRRAKSHVRRVQYQSTSSHRPRQDSFRKGSTDALNEYIVFEQVMELD